MLLLYSCMSLLHLQVEDVDHHTKEKHPRILFSQKEPEPTSSGCNLKVQGFVENKISEELTKAPDLGNIITDNTNLKSKGEAVQEPAEVVRIKTLKKKAEEKLRDLNKNLKIGEGGKLLRAKAEILRRRLEQLNQGATSLRERNLASAEDELVIQPQTEVDKFSDASPRGFTNHGSAPDSLTLLSHQPATVQETHPVLQKTWLPAASFPAQSESGAQMLYCCTVCPAPDAASMQLEDWMRHRHTQEHRAAYRRACYGFGVNKMMDVSFSHNPEELKVKHIA